MREKKKFVLVPSVAIALFFVITLGATIAFFNYTRTGGANTVKVGRVSFNATQNGTINLTNVFPIDSTEAETDTNNAKSISITVTGDTDYSEGLEYVITASDVNLTVNNKILPVTLEVSVTGNGLGTEETGDYYTNRESYSASKYKVEFDGELEEKSHLLVGYMAPNTTPGTASGINGTINIKAYLNKDNILITDTLENGPIEVNGYTNGTQNTNNKTVFTTTEWNSMQNSPLSFKIKVEANEGIWVVEPLTLNQAIARQVSTASYIASYDDIISSNPTFTTQDQVSTSATKQTVYYYTGDDAAANANVLFAGYCWQIIRTTDNGGVRILYNGVAVNNKCETTRIATKGINGQQGTTLDMSEATLFGRSYDYDLETGIFTLKDSADLPTSWNDTNYRDLIGTYTCNSSSGTCTTLYYVGGKATNPYVGSYSSNTYAYTASYTIGDVKHYSQLGTSAFNANAQSPSSVGYMFNEEYNYKMGDKWGEYCSTLVWENGAYTLSNGYSGTTPDATHRYICDTDCTKVRYYYYVSGSSYYYILLENGKTVEDALKEMINYKTNANDSDENINVYNSAIKGYLDNWYKKNLIGYTSYLDGASVYCNDRSIKNLGGWDISGTSPTGNLTFKQSGINGDLNLNCVNETDRFAIKNSKAKLSYPIGLLSEPERNLMSANFAKTGEFYWEVSPNYFSMSGAQVRGVFATGGNGDTSVQGYKGVRGVVTLRPGTKLEDGTGTYTDPYIVGPLVTRTN